MSTIETARVVLYDGSHRDVRFRTPYIGEGGCKIVFLTDDEQSVICLYKPGIVDVADPNRHTRLQRVLTVFNPTITKANGGLARDNKEAQYYANLFCWPTGIVLTPMLGVMTPVYPKNFFFSTGKFKGKDKEGKWFSSPKLRKLLPPDELGDWLKYLLMCSRMARAANKMHMTGIAHSDFSSKNILVDPGTHAACSIIDLDSVVVPNVFPPDVAGTPNYIAPEVIRTLQLPRDDPTKASASIWTDLHALGVLFYEYLLRRHPLIGPKVNSPVSAEEDHKLSMGERALFIEHPQDQSNRPQRLTVGCEHLGPLLQKQFNNCFINGLHNPRNRPTAAQWEGALCKTLDIILPCGNAHCSEKWFVYREDQKKQVCPWCGWKLKQKIPYFRFYYAPLAGQYRDEGHGLTGWSGRTLHEWHVFRNKQPNASSDSRVMADVHFHEGKWLLVNRALDDMTSATGRPVAHGQAVELKDGNQYHLSSGGRGRMVNVTFIG
ncbi:MAG: serine/threonine protein kinase [Verrucomicrobiae bacterium]|nr:serine/threonine protein kinase [Verrucomicrobiae bacterium]